MKRIKLGRPSPALVISCIALFVALGGVGYAAATIGSKQIKNNSVASGDIKNSSIVGKDVKTSGLTGSDVKANSLTGSDIAESGLGKVPSAGTADSAGTAGNANTAGSVGGLTLRKISFLVPNGTGNTTLFSGSGLTITASCLGDIALTAKTSIDNSGIYAHTIDTDNNGTDFASDLESTNFDVASTFNLLAGGDANPTFIVFNYDANGGGTVTGNLSADEDGGPDCRIKGTVIAG